MAQKGYSDIGTKLYHAEITGGAIPVQGFKWLVPVKSTSDKGSEPEQIDITSLDEVRNSYTAGRLDTPTQTYVLNNTPENATKVSDVCGKLHAFLEVYSDGTSVLMVGNGTTWINGVSLNSARDRTLAITCEDIIEKSETETTALLADA